MSTCPSPQRLRALLANQLDEPQQQRLIGHVERCSNCQQALDRLSAGATWPGACALRAEGSALPEELRARLQQPPIVPTFAQTKAQATPIVFPGPPTEQGPLGQVGDFHIQSELGEGAFGVVFRAHEAGLRRVVALKVLKPAFAFQPERARFEREARAAAAVRHEHIVTIHQVAVVEDFASPFLVMEFIAGGSLADHLEQQGRLSPREAANLVRQAALGLHAAHQGGLVHRDVKPANLLLEAGTGRLRVSDFGLARAVEVEGTRLTLPGGVVGTPAYMSPEQITSPDAVDARSDVYALGAVLYECLTGQPPFTGTNPMILYQVLNDDPRSPRRFNEAVPRDLETICLTCLNKDPARRYASASALAQDLARWLRGEPILRRPASRLERALKWARRQPAAASLLAVSIAAVLGLAVLSAVALRQWQKAVAALISERTAKDNEEKERIRRTLAQVDMLLSATPRAVPAVLDDLTERRDEEVLDRLRQVWNEPDTPSNRQRRMRAALALLPFEPDLVRSALVHWMVEVPDPAELLVIRDSLEPHAAQLRDGLWRRLAAHGTTPAQRLRILAALAAFDPGAPGWQNAGKQCLDPWLADDPLYLGTWTEALRPAREALLAPLTEVFQGKRLTASRQVAARILADYARDRPETMVARIVEADDSQFALLLPVLRPHREKAIALLVQEKTFQSDLRGDAPQQSEAMREAVARRQAGAGLTLARLGRNDYLWPLLRHRPYPETRSWLIHRLGAVGVPAATLVARLRTEQDVSIRRALILALGEYSAAQVSPELRRQVVSRLLSWYRHDPDPGIHGAIDWLLRHAKEGPNARLLDWQQAGVLAEIDEQSARHAADRAAAMPITPAGPNAGMRLVAEATWARAERTCRRWYVNGQGQTLVVLDACDPFLMGSPATEAGRGLNETSHWRRIGRRYALASKPVTIAQFQRFLKSHPEVKHDYLQLYSPDPQGPIMNLTWYEAAQYCRWLSEQEGFAESEMVYPSVAEIQKCRDGNKPLRLPADYLSRKGYRLPTEAEWEYACRAGARTSRFYGSSLELLPRYAWYTSNAGDRSWPVGQKKPNDLGLFDMHGNVWQWCQERARAYPRSSAANPVGDEEDGRDIVEGVNRMLRGGSFPNQPELLRAGFRLARPPTRGTTDGLRPARTCDEGTVRLTDPRTR